MTDEGKQMSISWNIFHGTNSHSYDMNKYGSWFINGLWLSVIGRPFLLWARLGGAVLMALMTLIMYIMMKKYYDGKYTIFIILAALMFVICENHPETKIDHSNLPTFLALLSFLFLILYIKTNYDFTGNYIFLVISSLMMLFSMFTRFPHILFFIFPMIYFINCFKKYKINKIKIINSTLIYYIPFFFLIIILAILIINNFIKVDMYKNILSKIIDPIFSIKNLFQNDIKIIFNQYELKKISYSYFLIYKYLLDFFHILSIALLFIVSMLLANKIYNNMYKKAFYNNKYDIGLFIILGFFIFVFLNIKPWMWYKATLGFFIAVLFIFKIKKIKMAEEYFYLYWGILLFFISFLGSNNSFRHSIPSGAVFMIFSIIALMNHKRRIELNNNNLMFLNKFIYVFFIIIFMFSFYKKIANDNKRDTNPIFSRNTMFKSSALFGIFSNKDRVDSIDGIINAVNENVKKDNTVLCFNSIPMMYYLLNKDYYLNDPWLIPYGLANTKINLELKAQKSQYPDFIIFSKKTAMEKNWPNTDIDTYEKDKELYEFIKDYISKNQYLNIYENYSFILFKRNLQVTN
jgi:hypothetical protein